MHRETVEDQHVSSVDAATDPLVASDGIDRDLWNVKVLPLVFLDAKSVRTFNNSKRSHLDRAVMEWNPYREELGISPHELVILMCVDHETLAVRKDQAADRFWMNQDLIAHQHLHDTLQRRLMR